MAALNDRVVVYRHQAEQWRWRRVAANNEIIADSSPDGYANREDGMRAAMRANAAPYLLELDADIALEIDASGRVEGPAA